MIISKNEIKYSANVITELGDVPVIEAIGGQINQVILNMILNAAYAINEKMKMAMKWVPFS